jgi:dipeptidyl aminopeptidase/acylaminoacyl peptidase
MASAVAIVVGACGGQGGPPGPVGGPSPPPSAAASVTPAEPSRVPPERLTDLVAYDHRRPLDVTTRGSTNQPKDGVVVTDLTFDGGFGQPVEAYLVAPLRSPTRRLAGVVFAHGAGRDRTRFLDEAKVLARRGALVLLPTVPMNMSGNADDDITFIGRSVIAQRRAIDVLVARAEVDRRRLGFVGHSWGAVLGAVLAGAEQRLAAVVIASFTKPVSKYFGATLQYRDQIAVFDQHRWLAMRGDRRVLLQAGRLDGWHPVGATDELFTAIAAAKERKDYHLGHDLVEPAEPVNDRREFLTRVLRLAPR